MKKIEEHKCYDGSISVWEHESIVLKSTMRFSVFLPPWVDNKRIPFITFLAGLTCNHENFTTKAGAYKYAAERGLAIIAPDTSPRGDAVPDDDAYDFGKGAGFYINATQEPWAEHFQMESYITDELNNLVCTHLPLDKNRQGICGHSMGGHGALTLFLKYPALYKSVSAFSPIVAPSHVPWGQKAFKGYLGDDPKEWKKHDASHLVVQAKDVDRDVEILIDQGMSDQFLEEQLKPDIFKQSCALALQKLDLRLHKGYDHSYYFIQTFISDHVNHHAKILSKSA